MLARRVAGRRLRRATVVAQDYAAIVAARTAARPTGRPTSAAIPVKLLAFTGVRAGMTVLDMGAGGGYSTELMARAVGPAARSMARISTDASARAKEAVRGAHEERRR